MASPVYAMACLDAASVLRRAAAECWTAFRPHREVTSSFGISTAVHLAVFLIIGTTLYTDGKDDSNIPELSVQLETREGPNDEEFTEAALPRPMPEPVDDTIRDPGSGERTLDAPFAQNQQAAPDQAFADALHQVFDRAFEGIEPPEMSAETASSEPALVVSSQDAGSLVTTEGESEYQVAALAEPAATAPSSPPVDNIPEREKQYLERSMQMAAQALLDSDRLDLEMAWEQDGQQYQARVIRQPARDSTGIERVIAEIVTHKDGKQKKTRLALKRLAFSHFTQLVNNWDPAIQLHDDVIDGRFHSNTEFSLTSRAGIEPRFFGKVTTAASRVRLDGFSRDRKKAVFQAGFETSTERVHLPREMPEIVNPREDDEQHVFTHDVRIIFNADGSFVWRHSNGSGELHRVEASERPRYLVGEKGVKFYVRGTVSGIFTLYTPHDIEIEDDLVYGKDPRSSVTSRDFLALISGRDIMIAGPNVTGGGDVTVHGAVFARRRFYIREVDTPEEATLVMYGSLTTGTLSHTEPRFATKIDFDKRFEYLRPASFPMTRRYEVADWDPDWEDVAPQTDPASLARSQ